VGNKLKITGSSFSGFCARAVAAIALLFMCYLLPMSFFRTTGMSTGGGIGEVVSFEYDNFFLNLIVLFISVCLIYLLWRFLNTVSLRTILIVMCVWMLIFGFAFVMSVKLQPSEDSYIVTFFARQAARGDLSYYHEYFRFFPYQFGFALYEECFFRLFNLVMPGAPEGFSSLALQGLNVVYTVFGYYALIMFAGLVFKCESVQKLTAGLMFLCLPALYFVTYMYGNVPAFACICGALWAFASFMRHERWQQGLIAVLLLALAVILKLNSLIAVVAVSIATAVAFVKKPGVKKAVFLVALLAAVLLTSGLPQRLYEKRSGIDFGDGIPQLGWLAMGVNEGDSCSGWYDPTYTTSAYKHTNYDGAATAYLAGQAIAERLDFFMERPEECLHFFGRKFLSQWNEPSYQGIWNNQLRKHFSDPGAMYELLCHRCERGIKVFMNMYQQFVFFGFTLGLLRIFRKKDMLMSLLPLVIIGGMLYHLLFEAKSQHSQSYFIMMLPVAAYGITKLFEFLRDNKAS